MLPVPLREELERQGRWLFRRRSYVPVAMIIPLFAALRDFRFPRDDWRLNERWELVCLSISLLGLAVRAVVVGYAPRGTSGRNTKSGPAAAELNTTGPYSLVRHPLYLGNFLAWLGTALVPRSAWLAIVTVLLFWVYYERIIFAEEEFLRRSFGECFVQWAEATPAFLPRLSGWRPPAARFSVRRVLRQEYASVLVLGAVFATLDGAGNWIALGKPVLDPQGLAILLASLLLAGSVWLLRQTTGLPRGGPR